MFADPLSNLMLVIFLFFAGLVVMFAFIIRSLNIMAQNVEESRKQMYVSIIDLERKVAELALFVQQNGSNTPQSANPAPRPVPQGAIKNESALASMEDLVELFDTHCDNADKA